MFATMTAERSPCGRSTPLLRILTTTCGSTRLRIIFHRPPSGQSGGNPNRAALVLLFDALDGAQAAPRRRGSSLRSFRGSLRAYCLLTASSPSGSIPIGGLVTRVPPWFGTSRASARIANSAPWSLASRPRSVSCGFRSHTRTRNRLPALSLVFHAKQTSATGSQGTTPTGRFWRAAAGVLCVFTAGGLSISGYRRNNDGGLEADPRKSSSFRFTTDLRLTPWSTRCVSPRPWCSGGLLVLPLYDA